LKFRSHVSNIIIKFIAVFHSFDWGLFGRDGIHLSHEGSKIVAKEILKVLESANWEPSLHWKSMPNEFAEDSLYDPVAVDEKTTVNVSNWSFQKNSDWERDLCISKPLNGH
jgi:hypothetical protein